MNTRKNTQQPIEIDWASAEDHVRFAMDRILYGTAFLERDDVGLWHRVDPTTVAVAPDD